MANMAEEVKDERKALPKAMLGSIILTTIVYVLVSSVAVLTISPAELAAAGTPLAKVVESA
jgi:amino acid transporter